MAALLLAAALACSQGGAGLSPEAREGRKVYLGSCTTCHNRDPNRIGSLGPPVAGASRELLEARLLRAAYPPGYTPKRSSNAMPAFPQLENEIDELAAYLAEVDRGSRAGAGSQEPEPRLAQRPSIGLGRTRMRSRAPNRHPESASRSTRGLAHAALTRRERKGARARAGS